MAVPEQTPYIEHTGNGVTTSFSLGFQCESKDHLIVLVDDIEPPIATWSLTGGNVVFTTAPAAGKKITLQRNTPFNRNAEYRSFNNSFRPQTVNIDFDRIWWKLQELGVADWLMKLYVDRLHQQQEQEINDLKDYVDDRDDELRAYLMEEIRKQGVALDQLDEYYNYLMERLAQIAVDKGWDASFVVDGDKTQKQINDDQEQLNSKFKNRTVYFEDFVSDVTGSTDVTAEMQSLLDSHDGDIYAKSTSIFKTSNTLFNRKHNRTIDFHNAKIVNKANSRYAILTISPTFVGTTDAELNVFITERHYGQEVRFSHVVNLRYEMSANTGGGNNLGAGIVYGYKCKLSRMFPSMTNGNGVEIRNSLRCGLYRSEILGHRNYTCFVFMSQRCEIIGNKFKGGARGVCTKMNRDGDSYCGHIIAFNTFEDATTSGRVIIGGEWRETTLTHEIYVPGHEWVDGNEVYGNTFINIAQPQTISMCVFSRNWKIYDNTFKWNNLSGSIFNIGGEGNPVAGEKLGGGHDVYDNYLYDYNTAGNAIINARLSSRVFNNHFFNCRARHMYYAQVDIAGNKLDYAKFFANNFHGDQNGIYCNAAQNHGFTATDGIKNFSFNENEGILNILASGSYTSAQVVASNADTTDLQGGDLSLIANTGVNGVTGAIVYRGTVRNLAGRKVTLSAPTTAIALQLQSGVIVESKHENNTYVLVGTSTTARAVVNNTDFIDGVNSYVGVWSNRIFNNFEKPVGTQRDDRQSGAMPSAGTYQRGDFIRNTSPGIVANSVVFGWLRITDGGNHVLNTDWVEIKQSTI